MQKICLSKFENKLQKNAVSLIFSIPDIQNVIQYNIKHISNENSTGHIGMNEIPFLNGQINIAFYYLTMMACIGFKIFYE